MIDKFQAVLDELGIDGENYKGRLHSTYITDSQMQILCEFVGNFGFDFKAALVSHPNLTNSHVDRMLHNNPSFTLIKAMLEHCNVITAQHTDIMLAMAMSDRWGYMATREFLVKLIFSHPSCSESVKVSYHLKYG